MVEQTRNETGHEQLLEELRQLLDALALRAEDYLRGCAGGEVDSGSGACGWCPICAAAGLLRGQRPELTGRVAEQLAGFLQALRQLLTDPSAAPQRSRPEEAAEERTAPTKVQHIAVRRVNGQVLNDRVEAL